ncbi:unnamed protein product [Callosobruchus maculatus]|uniref:Uncharacterized protein n=1 Tax=Callosobruchus maculatus TaxID=64391 RepID=A0A653BMB0_CALMS|nr:unnamed protein product [Callosobruchus maculatus]VEN47415.1 unnamed protein product [Callosobruchus maculatus]VEN48314.1 unnamed protein product [Callosobruchus maculatus]VEN49766.1 unnamed protein product [Callosobruchus maculatus]VEN57368.1 unnamed protein product [Callosobruchus maculatus]
MCQNQLIVVTPQLTSDIYIVLQCGCRTKIWLFLKSWEN